MPNTENVVKSHKNSSIDILTTWRLLLMLSYVVFVGAQQHACVCDFNDNCLHNDYYNVDDNDNDDDMS